MIYFDNKSSDDLGVYVEYYPRRHIPARKYEKVSVPGRNGDLIFTENAFENYVQTYEIYISAKQIKTTNAAKAVAAWLMKPGYRRLEDSYDPEVFRMAFFMGGAEIENYLNEFGRTTLEFDCMPQRWLKSGEQTITVTNTKTIYNPTEFISKPLIKINGSGIGTLTVNGVLKMFSGINGYLMVDSETMNCYKENQNCNSQMGGSFPEFGKETTITIGGGITSAEVIPRWFTI